jgi:peptidoglycan/xylan/chitin deacetylase (PgdA/CDA1 family)
VALTFDDGPSGDLTKKLLEGLAQRDVKSTFFVCGYRLKYYPTIPQLVLDYGHELGLHTFNHPNLKELSREEIRKELQDTWDLLPEGSNVTLMRPPGGNYNSRVKEVCKEMGLGIMLWSLDTRDWATNDVDEVVNKIVSRVKDGDVILMHELKNSSIQAALKAIDILKAQGYEFVTVSQLAAIKGETLEPGHVYTKP